MKFYHDIGKVNDKGMFVPLGENKEFPIVNIVCKKCGFKTSLVVNDSSLNNLDKYECAECGTLGKLVKED